MRRQSRHHRSSDTYHLASDSDSASAESIALLRDSFAHGRGLCPNETGRLNYWGRRRNPSAKVAAFGGTCALPGPDLGIPRAQFEFLRKRARIAARRSWASTARERARASASLDAFETSAGATPIVVLPRE